MMFFIYCSIIPQEDAGTGNHPLYRREHQGPETSSSLLELPISKEQSGVRIYEGWSPKHTPDDDSMPKGRTGDWIPWLRKERPGNWGLGLRKWNLGSRKE